MSDLTAKTCKPCEGGVKPLTIEEAQTMLAQVSGWELVENNTVIVRQFKFKNFHETMAFVNAVAWVAHQEDHHPDVSFGYKTCEVRYSTHAIGGLSENDFICAAKIDNLLGKPVEPLAYKTHTAI
ncbi:4a-hydroxytetrahydrobiopterin dehydratase [Candidatus Albibeggiatoa sp. nov. NOAA]|uniref:4a-hydroxytetrahydrobiopterin dehydratase n=1 Tax=Candidatus Albibeggiatoa sp. nov. NOAA TaxID=3162724 RepID=UPI0032F9F47D|nr:4a-hydroxytetrahydrobiopterin dehydratase [Thiotrichaceae bacterium]